MDSVQLLGPEVMDDAFIEPEHLAAGQTQYSIRDTQAGAAGRSWRRLTAAEQEILVRNGNSASDWSMVRVSDGFDPSLILNTSFFGLVRIGTTPRAALRHHDLTLPVGITNSRIISCDIGDAVAIHNVNYLAHYIVGDRCILTRIDEMHVSNHAKFGNGIVKRGEDPDVRITLDVVNETGSRAIVPFDGMLTADAYLWARYRDDPAFLDALRAMTDRVLDDRRGYYGTVGEQTVIKNTRIIKDVRVGDRAYIKGANKLKNLTINSSDAAQTQIGEGVELVNGIIGYGCRIFYGCKAVRFIMGNNSNLKYGARLIHSFLGANSTVSCCELLNNLIFPAHEQHHNNSFLVAALVGGQSNIAAGATIGSNHNSRSNDNEIIAGRGFWPGLSTTLKHSSRFAAFLLIAKGDYPAELDIPLPFALLSHNLAADRLDVVPAFWWTRNMYALARNSWKFGARDNRPQKLQNIVFEALAPDTVEEIAAARDLLAEWVGTAARGEAPTWTPAPGSYPAIVARRGDDQLAAADRARGRDLLESALAGGVAIDPLDVVGLEKSRRPARIADPVSAWEAYGEMLHVYAARVLVEEEPLRGAVPSADADARRGAWENVGGQLIPAEAVADLRRRIVDGTVRTWDQVHEVYNALWQRYPDDRREHARAIAGLIGPGVAWAGFFHRAAELEQRIAERVVSSRRRDYTNPFRIATYRSPEEMEAAIGPIDENSFIRQVREAAAAFAARVKDLYGDETP